MNLFCVILIFEFIFLRIFDMIRRLFTTFLDTQPLPTNEFMPTTNGKLSTKFKSSQLESLNWLHAVAPCFPVLADNVTIIDEPNAFYQTLLSKCESAKKRIVLASLYLGIGQLEENIVSTIKKNLKQNSNLKINVLLDYTRGTRGEINSQTTLHQLITENDNFCLSLYHTPYLRGLTKRFAPPRFNELIGLQHMKLYLFDNTVIMSGANLSHDYFTNRQDRYIMIEDKNLADFYADFINKVQEFSLKVNSKSEMELHPNWNLLPYKCKKVDFAKQAKQGIYNYFTDYLEKQKKMVVKNPNADTWIFPLIEMGQLSIHHDSIVTKNLLASSLEGSKMKFATGYFNLTEEYMDTITNECLAQCSILMAHPNANGFSGAKGPAGSIPTAYTLIAKKFYEKLVKAKQQHRVSLMEYEKPGWSYHAKGLWYYLPDSPLPNLTLIGSSNFGERSVNRDLETQMCLVTTNKPLQTRLQAECDHLYKLGSMAEGELLSRSVPTWVKTVVFGFKNFF